MTVSERLAERGSEKFRDFQSKLVPNIPKETILGVKTPDMRKIAKEINGTSEAEAFLADLPHKYYEENLVHASGQRKLFCRMWTAGRYAINPVRTYSPRIMKSSSR